MKKLTLCGLSLLTAMAMEAQKIDFNLTGKESTSTADGYTSWAVNRAKGAQTMTVDGVTVKVETSTGADIEGNGVMSNWWKDGVNKYDKLISDGVYPIILDASNNYTPSTTKAMGLKFTISGLSTGEHSICAYHNNTDGITTPAYPNLKVLVNGVEVASDIQQTTRQQTLATSGMSYVKFNAVEGQSVVVEYISCPKAGMTYPNNYVVVNSLVFDRPNPKTAASEPYPENLDYHVDGDAGFVKLTWKGGSIASKRRVYIGTSPDNMQMVKEFRGLAYEYDLTALKSDERYGTTYWRIDEIDSKGNVYEGDVWTFRVRHLAFPGAEGYGRFATGGRGGIVYHVTNLSDDANTPGSLRYGLVTLKGPRTIVFDVSGIIDMGYKDAFVNSYCTIAGQTAPGKGICIKHASLNINEENICRFLRAKRGYGGSENTGNAMGASGANNTIIDHCTLAWGTDETFSSRGAKNHSFQYNIIAEALGQADHKNYVQNDPNVNHGYAATIDGRVGSHHHNLLVNCYGRNWSMGGGMDGQNHPIGQLDLFNNVCYNWGSRTTDGGCHEANFVNNYYKMGPDTKKTILYSQDYEIPGVPDEFYWKAYVAGNIRENINHTLTNDALGVTYQYTLKNGASKPGYDVFVTEPFFESFATIHTAKQALKIVTSDAGATMPCRDNQHQRVTKETITGTYTYVGSKSGIRGEIDRESDITGEANGGWEEWPEEQRANDWDSDGDGMPDWYEKLIGSDNLTANNNDDPDNDGYTLLEEYLEFIAHPYLVVAPGDETTYDCQQNFVGFRKSPVYSIVNNSSVCTSSSEASVITVKAGNTTGLGTISMTVVDSDGDTFTQQLGIAVTNDATAVPFMQAETQSTANAQPMKRIVNGELRIGDYNAGGRK